MEDWLKIKTEYITTDTSYRKLAEKYGVNYSVIGARARTEGWVEERTQFIHKTHTKTLEEISKNQAKRAAQIYKVADKLLLKIEAKADGKSPMKEKDIRALTAALRDLKEIQNVRSDLDRQEQEARIANLRKQADPEQKETATLIVEGLPEEFRT